MTKSDLKLTGIPMRKMTDAQLMQMVSHFGETHDLADQSRYVWIQDANGGYKRMSTGYGGLQDAPIYKPRELPERTYQQWHKSLVRHDDKKEARRAAPVDLSLMFETD